MGFLRDLSRNLSCVTGNGSKPMCMQPQLGPLRPHRVQRADALLDLLEQKRLRCDVIALTCALQHETRHNRSMSDLRRSSRVKDRYRDFEPGLSSC
jgi:hypothetical protein